MIFHRVIRYLPALWPAVALPLLLASCKSVETPKIPGITPYRMVIQQGNFISQEMVSQLKPGMTREQVRFIMGTPLVTDIFHADRWDYVFFREMPNGKREQRNMSVVFEKDKLARVIGDLMPADGSTPAASGFDPQIKPDAKPAAKPVPEVPKEAAKPAAEPTPAASPSGQNWRTASDAPEKKPEDSAAAAKEEPKKPGEPNAVEEPKEEERGFFGSMLEKIGL